MAQVIRRVAGETGNPITGTLDNLAGDLADAIPQGSTITVSGVREDTGQVVIADRSVSVSDWPTLAFTYADANGDWSAPWTARLRFKAVRPDGKVVYVPDDDKRFGLFLVIEAP